MSSDYDALSLRPITDADLPFLYRVYAMTRWEELAPTGWTQDQKEEFLRQQFMAQHEWWQKEYDSTSFDIVERGGTPVGRLYVARWERELRIVDIAILPEYRGGGIGTRLVERIMSEAEQSGRAVRIHVEAFNRARNLYERLGFAQIENKGVYLLMERAAPIASASAQ
ncbi:MAG: GNAT family N-acetyltransferase [bacterium]